MPFLYETHLHTSQTSRCGSSTGAEHVRFYKDLGYTGLIVTDHFFNGSCHVPKELPWKERIERYCAGYEDALIEGQKLGLDVFFGVEHNWNGDDYLIYGIDKAWMIAHPQMEHWTRREQYEAVRAAGGCVVQAHPFRTRDYIARVQLAPDFCDAIEAANAGNDPHNDAFAFAYAKKFCLQMTSGSDNHCSARVSDPHHQIFGVALEERLTCIDDYARLIRSRQPIGLCIPENRFDTANCPQIESFYVDGEGRNTPTGRLTVNDWMR